MSFLKSFIGILIFLISANRAGFAQTIITQWNFNGPSAAEVPGGTNAPTPSIGIGSANLQGGTSGNFFSGIVNGGSSDPEMTVPPNYAWGISSFPSQGNGSGTAGVAFFSNTSGFQDIQFLYDIRSSLTAASRWIQFEYTLNGVNWVILGDNGGSLTPGEIWFNQLTIDLSGIPGANDNPNFGIRLVSIFSPIAFNPGNPDINYPPNSAYHRVAPDGPNLGGYSANGTWRFDMVTFTGACIPLNVNIVADQNPLCAGENTDLNASGSGVFEWSNGGSGSSINVAPQSTQIYSVTVTENGCSGTASITITVNDPIAPLISGVPNEICVSSAPVGLPTIQSGITGNWSGQGVSNNSFNPNGLSGPITLSFTPDAGQCATVATHIINVVQAPTASASNNGPVCSQQGDVLMLNAEGGVTYAWSGPNGFSSNEQNPVINDPQPSNSGTYTVTVTDGSGCTATAQTTVTVYEGFSLEGDVLEQIDCANGNSGSISISLNGLPQFFPPPTFEWEHPPGFDPFGQNWDFFGENIFENLPPGTYGLTITDARGCFASIQLVITEPDPLVLDCFVIQNESSPGASDGSFGIDLSGGTPDFDILITGPLNFNELEQPPGTYTYSSLPPGTYEIEVTDENGCTQTCTIVINPSACELEVMLSSLTEPSCSGYADGSILIAVSGQAGNVTYNWQGPSPIGNSPQGDDLLAGIYTVTVTDDNDCVATLQVILDQPDLLQIDCQVINNESSSGAGDASISVNITGGVYPGNITLIGPSGSIQQVTAEGTYLFPDLSFGNYIAVFEDANGCLIECELVVLECGVSLNLSVTEAIICFNGQNGALLLEINGAFGSTFISWNNGLPPTTEPTGLIAGLYSVTVTDDAGCSNETEIQLIEPDQISLSCSAQSEVNGGDGSISIDISGGSEPYDIVYAGPVNGTLSNVTAGISTINDLPAGAYTLVVTDENGCTESCQVVVQMAGCDLTIQMILIGNINCAGDNNAELLVEVNNGNAPFSFNWNAPIMIEEDEDNPTNLAAGTYSVTVSDADGCTAVAQVIINEPLPLTLICASLPESNSGSNDGQLVVNLSGGTPEYTVTYSGPMSGIVEFQTPGVFPIPGLTAGMYQIAVTDVNGCTATCSVIILEGDCAINVEASFNGPRCPGESTGEIGLAVSGATGNVTYQWSGPVDPGNIPAFTMFPAGVYFVTVTDEASCSITIEITLTDPPGIILTCRVDQNASAPGASDGQASISWVNGTPPFSYTIDGPNGMFQSFTNNLNATFTQLPAGTYTVTVTDMGGCSVVCSFTVLDVACDIELSLAIIDPIRCFGNNEGRIQANITGATGMVNYQWSPVQPNSQIISNLTAGTYMLTVTDGNGCTATGAIQIVQPPLLVTQCSSTPTSSPGTTDGSLTVNIQGGVAPYGVTWSGASQGSQNGIAAGNFNINNLIAGQYLVIVRDANGCETSCIIMLLESPCDLSLECRQLSPSSGPGVEDGFGRITILGNGTNQQVTLVWDGPSPGMTIGSGNDVFLLTMLSAGVYTVTVTGANGCTAECSFEIEEAECDLNLECNVVQQPSASNDDGLATATWEHNAPCSYQITGPAGFASSGQSSNQIVFNGLASGTYQVIIIAPNGCRDTCEWILNSAECELAMVIDTENVSCAGKSDGSIFVNVSNQIGTASIMWTDGSNDFNRTNLNPGIYAFTVSDDADCALTSTIDIDQPLPASLEYIVFQPDCERPFGSLFVSSALNVNLPATALINGQSYNILSFPFQAGNLLPGQYQFDLLDAELCDFSFTFNIEPVDRIRLISQVDRIVNRGETVSFEVLIDGQFGDIDQSEIRFNDQLLCSNCMNTSMLALQNGLVTIRIVDTNGCGDVISFNLIVRANNNIFIPDVFTPNGDGINDLFEVYAAENVGLIKVFQVYNRWGAIVFDSAPFTPGERIGWDGTFKNVQLDPAAFVYLIEVELDNGESQIYSGEIILAK